MRELWAIVEKLDRPRQVVNLPDGTISYSQDGWTLWLESKGKDVKYADYLEGERRRRLLFNIRQPFDGVVFFLTADETLAEEVAQSGIPPLDLDTCI